MMKTEELMLTQEWDKTFPKDDRAAHRKVTFGDRYGITLAGDGLFSIAGERGNELFFYA